MTISGSLSALACLAALPLSAEDVKVGVFSLFTPTVLEVRPAPNVVLESGSKAIQGAAWHRLRAGERVTGRGGAHASFQLRLPGRITRWYFGTLTIDADHEHLRAVVTMPIEIAVASVIFAETTPGTSFDALKAQAIVARSYLLANPGRHGSFDACDTTHCQFLREQPSHGSPAERAAQETRGLVLTYEGQIVSGLYSAQCGGRTRTAAEAGWQTDPYPYFSVECKPCRRKPISGHRIGLCQHGAAVMAKHGAKYDEILGHYFPGTRIEKPPLPQGGR